MLKRASFLQQFITERKKKEINGFLHLTSSSIFVNNKNKLNYSAGDKIIKDNILYALPVSTVRYVIVTIM